MGLFFVGAEVKDNTVYNQRHTLFKTVSKKDGERSEGTTPHTKQPILTFENFHKSPRAPPPSHYPYAKHTKKAALPRWKRGSWDRGKLYQ